MAEQAVSNQVLGNPAFAQPQLTLEAAVEELAAAAGARLQAIYSFGSDFGRGPRVGRGRLLLLLDQVDVACLESLVQHVTRCQASAIKVRVDTVDNLIHGADAFPAFTLELRDNRQLLKGADVLSALKLDTTHLRLHVEHGLRSMLRELVDFYLDRDVKGFQAPALRKSLRKLVYLLEGALICSHVQVPDNLQPEAIIELAQDQLLPNANTAVWRTIREFAADELPLKGDGATQVYASFFSALDSVIAVVDALED